MKLKGIVLAGGKSSRFGEDKALAEWGGQTLLARAVGLLSGLELDPVVISNSRRDYSFLTCPVVNDLIPEKGPLGGLYTACALFPELTFLVLTCDMPLLNRNILKRLISYYRDSYPSTVMTANNKTQPFPGIYKADLKNLIHEHLLSNQLSMGLFFKKILNRQVRAEASEAACFQNVNHQRDLRSISKGLCMEEALKKQGFYA
jgi:molybdopterin-guanine dinucleotide biosynthesis protein A